MEELEFRPNSKTKLGDAAVAIIAEGTGTISEGLDYRWILEDTGDNACRLVVWIDAWGLSRCFPAALSPDEAEATAEEMAPALLAIINS